MNLSTSEMYHIQEKIENNFFLKKNFQNKLCENLIPKIIIVMSKPKVRVCSLLLTITS